MRALVINLDRATARMDFQQRQLTRLGIVFERLPAVTVGDPEVSADEAYWAKWQRPIAPTERACLCSHIAAWRHVAQSGQAHLILEDDALLSDDVPAVLKAAQSESRWDLLQLETRQRHKVMSRSSTKLGPIRVRRLYFDRAGAAGYVLWPSGAARLLARAQVQPALADALIAQPGLLRAYQAVPAQIIQNDIAVEEGIAAQWLIEPSSVSSVAHRGAQKSAAQKGRRIVAQIGLGLRGLWARVLHHKCRVPFAADQFTSQI